MSARDSKRVSTGRWLPRASPSDPSEGKLVAMAAENLGVDISASVTYPVFSPFMSVSITALLPISFLDIQFYCSYDQTGVGATNIAVAFRFRFDGILIPASRATTDNAISDRNMTVAYNRRLIVLAGLHTVSCEWTQFGGASTMQCHPASRPDEHGAVLWAQEQAP